MRAEYEEVKKELLKADKILLISHRKPDADTLGSVIALRIWLNKLQKRVTMACIDSPSSSFRFLPYLDEFVYEFDINEFDLIVVLDAGASYMTDFHRKYSDLFFSQVTVINIDHHASNDNYGNINIVEPESPSVTFMLYKMFKLWNVDIDKEMAICLLAGIYNDTGSFMHSNTTQEVFAIAADLMNRGARICEMNKCLFRNKRVSTLRLWGKALENVRITEQNVAMSVVRDEDYEDVGAEPEQLSGVIDYINMVPGVNYSVLLNEDRKGNVKGSFRTKNNDVDLSRIASKFGGGGHPKASGFCLPGKLEKQSKYKIVSNPDENEAFLDF